MLLLSSVLHSDSTSYLKLWLSNGYLGVACVNRWLEILRVIEGCEKVILLLRTLGFHRASPSIRAMGTKRTFSLESPPCII